jgi:toxin secretion/phage lysis holin
MLNFLNCIMSLKNDKLIVVLSVLVGLDFLSGYTKAFVTGKTSSKVGTAGLIKHMTIYFLIIMFDSLFKFINFQSMGELFVLGGIGTNGISIIENYRAMGWKGSTWIEDFFKNISDQTDKKGNEVVNKMLKGEEDNA